MTAPSGKTASVGFRNCRVYALNASGVPAASSTTPYEGVVITAARALEITHPEARRVTHFGDDYVFMIDRLPPTETVSGVLRTGKQDNAVDALLSGVNAYVVGEAEGINIATDQQGYEPLVGLLGYQQGGEGDSTLGALYGGRVWRSMFLPKTWLILQEQGMSEAILEPRYAVFPQLNAGHLWGLAYSLATEGSTLGQIERYITTYKPLVVAWKSASGTPTKFLFSATHPAAAASKIHMVTLYTATTGVVTDITATAVKEFDGITPAAIANNDIVIAFYEVNLSTTAWTSSSSSSSSSSSAP